MPTLPFMDMCNSIYECFVMRLAAMDEDQMKQSLVALSTGCAHVDCIVFRCLDWGVQLGYECFSCRQCFTTIIP